MNSNDKLSEAVREANEYLSSLGAEHVYPEGLLLKLVGALAERDRADESIKAEPPRCPKCGYTRKDCRELMDHHLCGEPEPMPACMTCGDSGWIGGPSYSQPDEGGEPCPDCNNQADAILHPPVEGAWVMVPKEVMDRFPEINPSNYGHDDALALNGWGVELINASRPTPPADKQDGERPRVLVGTIGHVSRDKSTLTDALTMIGRREMAAKDAAPAPIDDDWHLKGYAYASKQSTICAGCGKEKHTPLRIDAMGGYVCLTCIDQKLGSLLGEFGYAAPAPSEADGAVAEVASCRPDNYNANRRIKWLTDQEFQPGTKLYTRPQTEPAPAVGGERVDYWCAVDADDCVEFGMSADDANDGEAARQEMNDWINDQLNEFGSKYRLVGLYAHPPAPQGDARDAERYRIVRRGQYWDVVNGIGDVLRAEALDAAADAAITAQAAQEPTHD